MTRHSREAALSEREFELLLEGATRCKKSLQSRFVALAAGRLGLRGGEIAHMTSDWLDWRRNMIQIPSHESCEKGRFGGVCGYCRSQAEQMADHNDDLSFEDALDRMWSAKTPASARSVPWDFSARIEIVMDRFFDQYDAYPCSRQSVNRRVERAAEHADGLDPADVFPHALRSTAASFHAARGLDVLPLQSMFGWAQLSTAEAYLSSNPDNTQRALHAVHSR